MVEDPEIVASLREENTSSVAKFKVDEMMVTQFFIFIERKVFCSSSFFFFCLFGLLFCVFNSEYLVICAKRHQVNNN